MSSINPFVLNKSDYKRDIDLLKHYIHQTSTYLSTMTGKSFDDCKKWVIGNLSPGGKFEFIDPNITYLERQDNGDRIEKKGTLLKFINDSIEQEDLIAPNFTCYTNPNKNQSILVNFIDDNVKARSMAKKAMFKAEIEGNKHLQTLKKIEQGNKKISNNSISGGHVSSSTVLVNKTAHSTLTSNCRSTSGNGNANNEKLLSGNRHYWNPNIVISNIISIICNSDYEKIQKVIEKYNLVYPSQNDVLECITYSTNLYWKNKHAINRIKLLISKLTPLQRACFVYTSDLYHIKKHNDSFVREFISNLISKKSPIDGFDAESNLNNTREEYHNLVKLFYPVEMKGKSLKDVKGTDLYNEISATVKNVNDTIVDYADFIDAFFVTNNLPASLAYFPTSIRRAALTSDTDSTIFTVQDWVSWYNHGKITFDDTGTSVAACMIFLAAESITHVLAKMSANFGIEEKRIHQVAMKNEFYFPVFVPTQVGKHYFAGISAQEGNLKKELEMEVKGVHLKSSNVPKVIMKQAEEMMEGIVQTVIDGKKISLLEHLRKVADVERQIEKSLIAGESTYFRKNQIKIAAAYTKGETESPYQHHLFWNEIFSDKYGTVSEPPYTCLKISVDLSSTTLLRAWLAKIKDREIANKLDVWLKRTGKTSVRSFLLSEELVKRTGIPEEIVLAMDIRKTVFDISSVFYIILETLGYYVVNKKITRLVSDEY